MLTGGQWITASSALSLGSEMAGTVRGIDPLTGASHDDTTRIIHAAGLPD